MARWIRVSLAVLLAAALGLAVYAASSGVATGPPLGRGSSCAGERCQLDDCCAALVVPEGRVRRAYDGASCTDPSFVADVSSFALDRFEVTVGRFRRFVEAGGGTRAHPPAEGDGAHPSIPGSGWRAEDAERLAVDRGDLERRLACGPSATWTATAAATDERPINCLTWYEAMAFCAWDGGRLPTEAEWNLAAAGGMPERERPWGTPSIDRSHAVFGEASPFAVGSCSPEGDGRWGHADLVGNVWEWTLDANEGTGLLPREGAAPCATAGLPRPCVDCASTTGSARVLRGGGFGMPALGMRVAIRRADDPSEREHVFGVRCARPVSAGERARVAPDAGRADAPSEGLRLRGFAAPALDVAHAAPLALDALGQPRALVVHACAWDPASPELARRIEALRAELEGRGIAAVLLLAEGQRRGQPADMIDAATFARAHALTLPVVIDEAGTSACDAATLHDAHGLLATGASADPLDLGTPLGQRIAE